MTSSHTAEPLLEIRNLRKEFPGQPPSVAVDDVSLTVTEGETFALVGESGCGKTTLTRLLLRLLPPTSGSVRFDGTDLLSLDHAALRPFRRQMQVVLQDPYSSMNPRLRIADIVAEPLVTHEEWARGRRGRAKTRERVCELLDAVGLDAGIVDRYPHEFSGDSASASRSHAPWPSNRAWWSSTSRPARSTSPSRHASSTCWPTSSSALA